MPRLIPDDGTGRERLVLVGEAPGKWENRIGKPFVGPAGQKQTEWWSLVGLTRADAFITNVYPYYPGPGRDAIKQALESDFDHWATELHKRLSALADPIVIVPTGNYALRALIGKKQITKHRGSVYEYVTDGKRPVKVIPTIHPAAVLRRGTRDVSAGDDATFKKAQTWERRCIRDWERIAGDLTFRDARLPQRERLIKPSLDDIEAFRWEVERRPHLPLAIDVETPRQLQLMPLPPTKKGKPRWQKTWGGRRVVCVGLSNDPAFGITVPTTIDYWGDANTLVQVWNLLRAICALPCEKASHNWPFDGWWMAQQRVPLVNYRWDSLGMHHALDGADDHDLAYLASVDTREPYWKDDAKGSEDELEWDDWELFQRYCATDALVCRELVDTYHQRLADYDLLDFYQRHYADLYEPILTLSMHGFRMNENGRKRKHSRLLADCVALQDQLTAIAGEPLYAAKTLSVKKLAKYLYETLRLPKQHDRKTRAVTTKEVVIRRLMLRFPKKLEDAGRLILEHRRKYQLTTFVKEGKSDADGRSRASYAPYAETGRLRSSRNPRGTGSNHQAFDRELLDLILPDEGCVLVKCDLSQAEDRVTKMLTRSPRLIALARMPPWEFDAHIRSAVTIFRIAEDNVTPEQRYTAKRARHGANYDLHGQKLSDELLKDGYVYAPDECQGFIDALHALDPEIKDSYHRGVRQTILNNRALVNSWGRVIDFRYERMTDDLYRRGYAFYPQSEVADLFNQYGFVPFYNFICQERLSVTTNKHDHDSLLFSARPEDAWLAACFLRASLERPRVYAGEELVIPVGLAVGRTGKMEKEWKKWPTRREFEEVVREYVSGRR